MLSVRNIIKSFWARVNKEIPDPNAQRTAGEIPFVTVARRIYRTTWSSPKRVRGWAA